MTDPLGQHLIDEIESRFRSHKTLAESALAQVPNADIFRTIDRETNSLAILIQHMGGNLRSRFTDFLTTDGEKPDRHRDAEFEVTPETTREQLMARWEGGWGCLLSTLAGLTPDDLSKTITIRHEPHTVVEALMRSLCHQAYHVGQIVMLAKHYVSETWRPLTVPRGQTEEFNRRMEEKAGQ
jgi:hypothetical protein